MNTQQNIKNITSDELFKNAIEGQKLALKELRERGIAIVYSNLDGNLVKEYPNGTITILKK